MDEKKQNFNGEAVSFIDKEKIEQIELSDSPFDFSRVASEEEAGAIGAVTEIKENAFVGDPSIKKSRLFKGAKARLIRVKISSLMIFLLLIVGVGAGGFVYWKIRNEGMGWILAIIRGKVPEELVATSKIPSTITCKRGIATKEIMEVGANLGMESLKLAYIDGKLMTLERTIVYTYNDNNIAKTGIRKVEQDFRRIYLEQQKVDKGLVGEHYELEDRVATVKYSIGAEKIDDRIAPIFLLKTQKEGGDFKKQYSYDRVFELLINAPYSMECKRGLGE